MPRGGHGEAGVKASPGVSRFALQATASPAAVQFFDSEWALGPGNRCPAHADMKTEKLVFADQVDIEIDFASVALAAPACRKFADMGVAESASTAEKTAVNSAWLVDFVLTAVAETAGASSAELIAELLTVADSSSVSATHVMAGENFSDLIAAEEKIRWMAYFGQLELGLHSEEMLKEED
ncbi:hypothetical protein M5K25_005854 [Dendrobium thyrsiflorum]|uniref:Uncharacterized protein n=1 Tax=Dendrobium thyrsiflorum TaxID=117978 RepID=A0ABD0VBF2_DENTH